MAHQDWREPASAEYREKRAAALKKLAVAKKAQQKAQERVEEAEREVGDLDAGARAFGLDLAIVSQEGRTVIEVKRAESDTATESPGAIDEPSTREIILEALEDAYPNPLKARELKMIIEQRLGRPIHYKTPGMTLYRLALHQAVHRAGNNWFWSPPATQGDPDPKPEDAEMQKFSWDKLSEELLK